MTKKKIAIIDCGIIDYNEALSLQLQLQNYLINAKKEGLISEYSGYLLLCEHNHVYTLGRSGKDKHLLLEEEHLKRQNIEFIHSNRGGDITYHGKGQITGYPIIDLEQFYRDVHKYVRNIEEMIIRLLALLNIEGKRADKYTGVWVSHQGLEKKICAIGVHISRWVTLHGFAFNISTDLSFYKNIIPCGIQEPNRTVTSLNELLKTPLSILEIKELIGVKFAEIFEVEIELLTIKEIKKVSLN